MLRSLLPCIALVPLILHAQGWSVGQPVEQQLSAITVYGGGCFPAIQAQLSFGQPPVDGVTYYYKVISITTDGEYTMWPGPGTALAVDDMIPVQQFSHQVYNSGSFGGLELQVWAIGTPTTAGQAHPCASSELWMSNLLPCNEGLNCAIASNCVTELGTGVGDAAAEASLQLPNAANGFMLQWPGTVLTSGEVRDLRGRLVHTLSSGTGGSLAHLPDGLYVLHLNTGDGRSVRTTFPIAR